MARLIRTGEIEAIDLKHLHSSDILYLDDEIHATVTGKLQNGGFAEICIEVKRGVVHLIKTITTSLRNRATTK